MARGRRIPRAGESVFKQRALLQEDFAAAIEDKNVYRAMAEAEPMHLGASLTTDNLITFIDHVKDFIGALRVHHLHSFKSRESRFKPGNPGVFRSANNHLIFRENERP